MSLSLLHPDPKMGDNEYNLLLASLAQDNTQERISLDRPISLANALLRHNYEDLIGIDRIKGFAKSKDTLRYLEHKF